MPLSNYIPNSRISQSGVVPNEVGRPASPYTGQVIYQLDTLRTLVWNGVAWVDLSTGTANQPGLEMIVGVGCSAGGTALNGVVTVGSAVSSVTVTDAFNSNYDNYLISWAGVSGTQTAIIQMGATTTGYRSNFIFMDIGAGIQTASRNNTVAGFDWVSTVEMGVVNILQPFLPKNTFAFASYHTNTDRYGNSGGRLGDTTSYTSFVFKPSSGTITGGTICVYGYRK
jgi:hypothetical protein